jgi:succinyl-diaminopimelate desuccinylase
MGANALQALLCFLVSFNEDCKKAYDLLFNDVTGLKQIQDKTGVLTMSPDVATFANGVLKITTDIRFPATHKKEEILDKITAYGVDYTVNNYQAPLYNNPNSKLISTLMDVYNQATGSNEQPIAIGGGTYARALECGCAFGPELNGEEATIHQPNEYVTFDRIKLMSEVYYNAIMAMCCTPAEKIKIANVKVRLCTK